MIPSDDLLQALASISPDSPLAAARLTRDAATEHAQGSYDVLFSPHGNGDFPLPARLAMAQQVAHWHSEPRLAAHYAARQKEAPPGEKWHSALAHAERLTFQPAAAGPAHLRELEQAGWSADDIVTLSQLVAFVSFQSRLLRGLRLLSGEDVGAERPEPAVAAAWRTDPTTASGQPAPPAFTRAELGWEPWLAAKKLEEFSAAEKATLAKFGHSDSDYFRLLGRNLPLLEQRTLTDKGIFYTAGGLPRKERELAATVASKVNGCIYCASVHARKAAQLSKQPEDIQRLIDTAPGQPLAADQAVRWLAIIDFAASLSTTPPTPRQAQLVQLRAQGLSELELLDLIQSTAFFAWANRLMLTLGEPFTPVP
ncbi:alkylhydroperoxidase domain protein (plasmid) [Erwinia persicina]|uniref:alkylhydroperoxidase domain protein n=1 Tax=Erwinia persicina TaxID=55211 RepID=UPI0030CC3A6B